VDGVMITARVHLTAGLSTTQPGVAPADPDQLYEAFCDWVDGQGIELYPAQDEALLELVTGNNVILATPTGSGKSLVAVAAHYFALAAGVRSIYTAPIKALVSEKFFALCAVFGSANVGMMTGDAAVNADAPIICCTAEVLANIALRTGAASDLGVVIMDEFHFYADPDSGWAWQVPLLELSEAQFLLMSATLGDVTYLAADLSRRTGRATATVSEAVRPVPLHHYYAVTPLHETISDLLAGGQAPIYVVHFTQAAALEHAQSLTSINIATRAERDMIADAIGEFPVQRRLRPSAVPAGAPRRRRAPRRDAAEVPPPR
jgi:superfamily II RNA helicase